MPSWENVRDKIKRVDKNDQTWLSNSKNLLEIVDKAEIYEIDPGMAEEAKISNLIEIIREARIAISKGDIERLTQLFSWAKELTNRELRVKLRGEDRPTIIVKQKEGKYGHTFTFEVTKEQLDRIEKSMVEYFEFKKQ